MTLAKPYARNMTLAGLLIYDGDCAFCKNSLRLAIKHLSQMPNYVAFQKIEPANYGLTVDQVKTEVWLVGPNFKLGGHLAVAWIFRNQSGLGWRLLGALIKTFSPMSAIVYRWVARNRHRLPGGTRECSIEDRP